MKTRKSNAYFVKCDADNKLQNSKFRRVLDRNYDDKMKAVEEEKKQQSHLRIIDIHLKMKHRN